MKKVKAGKAATLLGSLDREVYTWNEVKDAARCLVGGDHPLEFLSKASITRVRCIHLWTVKEYGHYAETMWVESDPDAPAQAWEYSEASFHTLRDEVDTQEKMDIFEQAWWESFIFDASLDYYKRLAEHPKDIAKIFSELVRTSQKHDLTWVEYNGRRNAKEMRSVWGGMGLLSHTEPFAVQAENDEVIFLSMDVEEVLIALPSAGLCKRQERAQILFDELRSNAAWQKAWSIFSEFMGNMNMIKSQWRNCVTALQDADAAATELDSIPAGQAEQKAAVVRRCLRSLAVWTQKFQFFKSKLWGNATDEKEFYCLRILQSATMNVSSPDDLQTISSYAASVGQDDLHRDVEEKLLRIRETDSTTLLGALLKEFQVKPLFSWQAVDRLLSQFRLVTNDDDPSDFPDFAEDCLGILRNLIDLWAADLTRDEKTPLRDATNIQALGALLCKIPSVCNKAGVSKETMAQEFESFHTLCKQVARSVFCKRTHHNAACTYCIRFFLTHRLLHTIAACTHLFLYICGRPAGRSNACPPIDRQHTLRSLRRCTHIVFICFCFAASGERCQVSPNPTLGFRKFTYGGIGCARGCLQAFRGELHDPRQDAQVASSIWGCGLSRKGKRSPYVRRQFVSRSKLYPPSALRWR
jgi:hypothetical protein